MSKNVRSVSRAVLALIGLVTAGCLLILLMPKVAGAVDVPAKVWSWTDAKPTVFSRTDIVGLETSGGCRISYSQETIVGLMEHKNVCLYKGKTIDFGYYFINNSHETVVGFKKDSKMYPLAGVPCVLSSMCIYLPDSDSLISLQYIASGRFPSLVLYRNFASRVKYSLAINPTPSGLASFEFDSSSPDYIFKTESQYAWPVNAINSSDNGRWVAVEIADKGFAILDVKNLTMRRVANNLIKYGRGANPGFEFAISNDGRHLAIMGSNADFTAYDINDECGQTIVEENINQELEPSQYCPLVDIRNPQIITDFLRAVHPRYNGEGGELVLYATAYSGLQQEVILHAAGYTIPRIDRMALGDSYTSGEGARDPVLYLPGTDEKNEKCHQSSVAYPFVLARLQLVDSLYVETVACSGATTNDIIGSDIDYWGQGQRLEKLGLDANQKTLAQTTAKEQFISGRVHQLSFAQRYRPKIITVGVGGNDVGLMGKLKSCVVGPYSCEWASSAKSRAKTAEEIKSKFNTFVNTFTQIRDVSSLSKVYVIGYPKIIDPAGNCDQAKVMMITPSEQIFMNETVMYLNDVIEAAAKRAGVKYVDIEDAFGDRWLCGNMNYASAMNGLLVGKDFLQESFHPTPIGHSLTASKINSTIGQLEYYDNCPDTTLNYCAQNVEAPDPDPSIFLTYWEDPSDTNKDDNEKQRATVMTDDGDEATTEKTKKITMPSYTFMPSSEVRTEIHSDPIVLGTQLAGVDGSFNTTATLPADLPDGYHTLHLYGTSYAGEPMDYYQVIYVQTPVTESSANTKKTTLGVAEVPKSGTKPNANNTNTPGIASLSSANAQNPNSNNPPKSDTKENGKVKGVATVAAIDTVDPSVGLPVWLIISGGMIGLLILALVIRKLSAVATDR